MEELISSRDDLFTDMNGMMRLWGGDQYGL